MIARLATMARARLAGDPGVSAIVGSAVHPGRIPQGTTGPAVSYRIAGGEPTRRNVPALQAATVTLEVAAWAPTYSEALNLGDAVVEALDGWTDVSEGIEATPALWIGLADTLEESPGLDELTRWGLVHTFTVHVRRITP